jgi:hypothetical protein
MTSNGGTNKTKDVGLNKLQIFVIDNVFNQNIYP